MADKKSSLVQIAQAVLDETTQSVKVAISVDGLPVDASNPMPVVIDSQSIVVDVNLDKENDDVTAWQGGGAWAVTNTHITEAVATSAKQDTQITELQLIKGHVDGVETKLDTLVTQTDTLEGQIAAIYYAVATATKQDTQITELQAIKGYVDGVEGTLTSVNNKLYSTPVSGNQSLHVTVDNQVTGLATLAEQQTQTTELTAIKGHVDQVEAKIDSVVSQLTALNSKSARLDAIHTSYLDYGTTNVTNAAWVTLATVPANVEVREIAIFDSSGEVGEIGVVATVGDTPTTVRTLIFPGGNMPMPIVLTAGQVLKIRAKSTILNTGVCVINYYGVSTL